MFLVGSCHEERSGVALSKRGGKRGGVEMDADQEVGCGVERTRAGGTRRWRGGLIWSWQAGA